MTGSHETAGYTSHLGREALSSIRRSKHIGQTARVMFRTVVMMVIIVLLTTRRRRGLRSTPNAERSLPSLSQALSQQPGQARLHYWPRVKQGYTRQGHGGSLLLLSGSPLWHQWIVLQFPILSS